MKEKGNSTAKHRGSAIAVPPGEARAEEFEFSDLLPRMKDQGYSADHVTRRRRWVEEKTGVSLPHIGSLSFDPEELRGNIENPIGVAQVPLGVAGPVLVHGQYANGLYYVPMATSEGALIRSYERGMVALTRAGGVQTAVLEDENQITPTFFFEDVASALKFSEWAPQHLSEMQAAAEPTTAHGRLKNLKCYALGRQVLVNFGFSTGDAQGMNMMVKATDAVCRWIQEHYPVSSHLIFSGMSSEKRASGFVLSRGKGKRVTAGALLPHDVLRMYLHVTAEQLFRVWHSTVIGHLQAGAIGYNGHYANGLTAIFIATGQDVANVVNSACGVTSFELLPEGLYVSATLPALSVATVGGGTALPTQREALAIMGCGGTGKAKKFAEVVAAAVLGGEISMGAAIASGEFVVAHEHYGKEPAEMSVVLVTGGSRGIGRAIVDEFAGADYALAFTYAQNRDAAEAEVAALAQKGLRAVAYQADARDFARAQEVVKEAQEQLGPITVLVNNAGIRRDRALYNMDVSTWQEVIETNLNGTFNYSRAVIGEMIRRSGVILNIASVSGVMGIAGQTNYSASKAGMIGFTKALSREVARLGVRVNAIVPGVIETEMTSSMEEGARKKLYSQVPMGKPGTAHEVARLALYLAGQDATYITGQVFTIDGGLS